MPDAASPRSPSASIRSLARLNRRLAALPVPHVAWSPHPLPDLIARIDAALAERRAG